MQDNDQIFQSQQQPVSAGLADKEKEAVKVLEAPMEEVVESEPGAEVAKHLVRIKEEVELPPDLKKMGVTTPAAAKAVSDIATTSLSLPLTDDQIALGLHAQILSSLRWLAEWCFRQLKKAHELKIKEFKNLNV